LHRTKDLFAGRCEFHKSWYLDMKKIVMTIDRVDIWKTPKNRMISASCRYLHGARPLGYPARSLCVDCE